MRCGHLTTQFIIPPCKHALVNAAFRFHNSGVQESQPIDFIDCF